MKTMKKIVAMGLASVMAVSSFSVCAQAEEKIQVTVGNWPEDTEPESVANMNKHVEKMAEVRPDVEIVPDTSNYNETQVFAMKAAAGEIPTVYGTAYTEIKKAADAGYVADITGVLEERGLLDKINPTILDTLKGSDGKIYAYPDYAYMMGIEFNKSLFVEAGLVNEDGTIKVPETWEELGEYAKIIKEKTGKAGFGMCTTNNWGGWHFMSIAWSYGVEFMKQRDDGTWEATFNTPEAVEALQYVKDLKWEYDAMPADTNVDGGTAQKLIGLGECAMVISPLPWSCSGADAINKYGMEISDYGEFRLPAGPAGRYAQLGGGVYMFGASATEEELNAAIDFLAVMGKGEPAVNDEAKAQLEEQYATAIEQFGVVFPESPLAVWGDPDWVAMQKEANEKYMNVDSNNFASYFDLTDVTLKPEEPAECQALYAVLDGCIQEVISNEDADCAAIIEKACNDFQVNHLDKM